MQTIHALNCHHGESYHQDQSEPCTCGASTPAPRPAVRRILDLYAELGAVRDHGAPDEQVPRPEWRRAAILRDMRSQVASIALAPAAWEASLPTVQLFDE